MSQYSHLSEPDPELAALLAQTTPPAFGALRTASSPHSQYAMENHTIAVVGGEICVRVIMPTPTGDENPEFPVMVWFHGGGWVLGDLEFDDFQLRMTCVELQITIVNLNEFRLAPEHQFPTGLDDCYAALKWTVNNVKKICASFAKGFIIGGVSAGANLAAAVVHRARNDPFFVNHKITGHILQIPALVHSSAYPAEYAEELLSCEQNKDVPVLNKAAMNLFYECLGGRPDDPGLSPLLADHSNLPPWLLYVRLLNERSVATKLDIYPGVPHGFNESFPQLTAAKKWQAEFWAGLAWILTPTI
ncbi:Alpha/Beta hydrolase protein [Mycena leptocephala]|nr:Alpha/Beta hydrolase protein [Mycena leptocephala]